MLLLSCHDKVEDLSQVQTPSLEVAKNDNQLNLSSEGLLLYNEKLFSGKLVSYYSDSLLASSAQYIEGKKHGLYQGYYESGMRAFVRYYKNGEKHHKHQGWYANGEIKFEYNFLNGLSEGLQQTWYDDGGHFELFNFQDGREFGAQKVWRRDGKIRANFVIREDGRSYGLSGLKRCKNIDTKAEKIKELTTDIYEK